MQGRLGSSTTTHGASSVTETVICGSVSWLHTVHNITSIWLEGRGGVQECLYRQYEIEQKMMGVPIQVAVRVRLLAKL
jgi:uncharacterized protein YfaQ (DUF2300 family)